MEDLRSLNLKNAISEFTDKIEIFRELTKSFHNNSSTLDHALDTIKHFIVRVEPDKLNDCFAKIDSGIHSLHNQIASLPSVAYLEDRLESLEGKLPNMIKLDTRIEAMEHRLAELSNISSKLVMIDDKLPSLNDYIAKLDSIKECVTDKVTRISSMSNSNDLTEHISRLESLCSQLSRKLELTNQQHGNTIPSSINTQSNPIIDSPVPNPKTCLIIGDSNTKHIKLDYDQINSQRTPT